MINCLVTMAGNGTRFSEAGYKRTKPFIRLGDTPMIQRVVENLQSEFGSDQQKFIFVIRPESSQPLSQCFAQGSYETFITDKLTEGAACSCLLAESAINNDDPLIIANSDQLVGDVAFMDMFLAYAVQNNVDGLIACFLNDDPKWSYVRLRAGQVYETAEKRVISNLATCGIYYYRRGRDFVEAAKSMIVKGIRTNGEYYVCPVYNEFLNLEPTAKVLPYMVNNFWGVGTPTDLEHYLKSHGMQPSKDGPTAV